MSPRRRQSEVELRRAPVSWRAALTGRLRADWGAFERRWSGEGDRRGLVLIMTMLMLTILTSLGSAAAVRTGLDLREGGAYRVERAAYRLSEAGMMSAISLAAQMQAQFEPYMEGKGRQLVKEDMGPNLLDLDVESAERSFGAEFDALEAAYFKVKVGPARMSAAVPGYDSSRYCFRSFRVESKANLGFVDGSSTLDQLKAGESGIAAQLVVGPVPCGR